MMSKVKYTRINLFNTLVYPDEVASGEWNFKNWCNSLQSEEEYLTQRSYLLLDFYSAFRKIYNFYFSGILDGEDIHLRKLYCDFSSDNTEMIITVRYKKPHDMDQSFYDAVSVFFDVDPGDSYDEFEMEPPGDEHKSLKLIFRKKG